MSDRALRRRLDALGSLIDPHLRRGNFNALLFSDQALAILDRLDQLQRDAELGLNDAVAQVKEELQNGTAEDAEPRPNSAGQSAEPLPNDQTQRLIDSYEARIEDLRRREDDLRAERDRLLEMLENRDDQIKALMPGRSEDHEPSTNGDNGHMGRLQALRYAFFGR